MPLSKFRLGCEVSEDLEMMTLSHAAFASALGRAGKWLYGDVVYLVVGFDLAAVGLEIVSLWKDKYRQPVELVVSHEVKDGIWYVLLGEMVVKSVFGYRGYGVEGE